MKSIPKTNISFNFYHLSSSTVLDIKANTKVNIKTTYTIALTSFSNFLSFNSSVFIFFVFCTSTEQYLVWHLLKVQSCKSYSKKYMIALTKITNNEVFTFIAVLVFKLLNRKVLFIKRKDNRNDPRTLPGLEVGEVSGHCVGYK